MKNMQAFRVLINFWTIVSIVLFINNAYAQNIEYKDSKAILKNFKRSLNNQVECLSLKLEPEAEKSFKTTDSILNTLSYKKSNYLNDLSKIYSAYSYFYNGIIYQNLWKTINRDSIATKKQLRRLIITCHQENDITLFKILKKEISVNSSILFFEKVNEFSNNNNNYLNFQKDSLSIDSIYKKFPVKDAYNMVSIRIKYLYLKTLFQLVFELKNFNDFRIDKTELKEFISNLPYNTKPIADIINNNEKIINTNEKKMSKHILLLSKIQSDVENLFILELKKYFKN